MSTTTTRPHELYPLSPMQQGMLFHSLLQPEAGLYVEQLCCAIKGPLDRSLFQQAWLKVVERHAILRTAFAGAGLKEPAQVVYQDAKLPFQHEDWSGAADVDARLAAFLDQDRKRGFTITEPPLMRLALFRVSDSKHFFVWTHHHALLDGWSVPIVIEEVLAFYTALSADRSVFLPPARPYSEFIRWLKRQDSNRAAAYWKRLLDGYSEPAGLPGDRAGAGDADLSSATAICDLLLDADTSAALGALARHAHVTLNTIVQGAWAILLSRYSGRNDVVFGCVVSGRPAELPGSERMVGLFINTLPVRVQVPANLPLTQWLQDLQAQSAATRQFEYSSLAEIQRQSSVPRRLPLFESIVVFENFPRSQGQGPEGSITIEGLGSSENTNYPVSLVVEPGETVHLELRYHTEHFTAEAMERFRDQLKHLLIQMCATGCQLSELTLVGPLERRTILSEWSTNELKYPGDATVGELFEAIAGSPDHAARTAVCFGEQTLTYDELNRRANQLARYLRGLGAGPESMVGISIERSLEMIVGVLAIAKAGAAYVPLDPVYPPDRLRSMALDTGIEIVLTSGGLEDIYSAAGIGVVRLDADSSVIGSKRSENLEPVACAQNAACVLYTSGSTGKPKGVVMNHRSIARLVFTDYVQLGPQSRIPQLGPLSFDASTFEIWGALLHGGCCLLHPGRTPSPGSLAELIRAQRATCVLVTTALFNAVVDEFPEAFADAREVLVGGEALSVSHMDRARRSCPQTRFINAYGPTECTTIALTSTVDPTGELGNAIPLGRPIANTTAYILDDRLEPVPVGAPGQLYLGGPGLARCYWNSPTLTAQRFIPNPHAKVGGDRLYATGDLARYFADGRIDYLGRTDDQIKIRGRRIEPGEVEATLKEHDSVLGAFVTVIERDVVGKVLTAFVKTNGSGPHSPDGLRTHLRNRLPEYMVPSKFVFVETLPLTPAGKVDRRALIALADSDWTSPNESVSPRDTLEAQLVQIWEEALDVRPIGVRQSFFDLGGHSLVAARVVAMVKQRTGRTLPLSTLFQEETVERIATALRRDAGSTDSSVVTLQPRGKKTPLVFVHPSGGSVHWYVALARYLGTERPFYGIQAKNLNGGEIHTSIEEMASYYIEQLRALQPHGPYQLGSWSFGIVIAYEMACQLMRGGEDVSQLILIDQGPEAPGREPEDQAAWLMSLFGNQLGLSLEALRQFEPERQVAYVLERAKEANFIYPDVTLEMFQHYLRIMETQIRAWRRYEAKPYPGRITLVRAQVQSPEAPTEPDMGWGRLAQGGVDIVDTPGDHLTMMAEPLVAELARHILGCLEPAYAATVSSEEVR